MVYINLIIFEEILKTIMEPVASIANTAMTILFSEALKQGGKALGEGVSEQITQLMDIIRRKFQNVNVERFVIEAENQPTESNIQELETQLIKQMKKDTTFYRQLENRVKKIEKSDVINQVMVYGIKAKNIEAGNMKQTDSQRQSVEQLMGVDLDVSGDIKFGDLTQER